jgi:hypothetical protein
MIRGISNELARRRILHRSVASCSPAFAAPSSSESVEGLDVCVAQSLADAEQALNEPERAT